MVCRRTVVSCVSSCVVALLTITVALSAYAAGIEFPDNGTRAVGRGGAFAADPDDGFALQYNPAGFAKQTGMRLLMDGKISSQSVRFAPADTSQDPVRNSAGPFLAPAGVASYGFGKVGPLSGLTVVVGAYGPSAVGKLTYPNDGAQRYGLIKSNYFIAYYSAGVAASYSNWLSFGAAFQIAAGSASFRQAVYAGSGAHINTPQNDALVDVSVRGWAPTGIMGVTVKPHKDVAIGFSWRPKMTFTGNGTVKTARFSSDSASAGATQSGDTAKLTLAFPDVLRLGVQYSGLKRWVFEVNGVYERWSVLDAIKVDPSNVSIQVSGGTYAFPSIALPKNFKDAMSVRAGADFEAWPERVTLRTGYMYETSAIPKNYVNVDFPNWGRHVVTAGFSVQMFGAYLDVAYAHHFIPTQHVSNSQVTQVVSPIGPPPSSVVGNGTYKASLDMYSLSLRIPFGELRKKI